MFHVFDPFDLSDQAFITSMSTCLGIPIPHTRVLWQSDDFVHIEDWADFLLIYSAHHWAMTHHARGTLCTIVWRFACLVASSPPQSDVSF